MKPDSAMTRRFLQHIMPPGTCIEFRVFKSQYGQGGSIVKADRFTSTFAGWFDQPDNLIVDASRLRGISGFVTFNPVNPDLLARSDNKLVKCKNATTDDDIVSLSWLYVDIDPVRPADISSTDAELALAVERRDRLFLDYPEIQSSSIWGKSGNGAWILVRLPDYPNDEGHRGAIGRSLKSLSEQYSDDRVKIDTATKNPARVMCIPGVYKCKGSPRPERPWRMTTLDGSGIEGNTR